MLSSLRMGMVVTGLVSVVAGVAGAGELTGSRSSMRQQHGVAVAGNFDFLTTPAQVARYVARGRLVPVDESDDLALVGVSFPYARAEVKSFVERLGGEYREATGAALVVTSLTRPSSLQPANSSDLSVHPAGMAADLRIPAKTTDRAWLEARLLELEDAGVLDVTREKYPPHYHVAVFPAEFATWAAAQDSIAAAAEAAMLAAEAQVVEAPVAPVVQAVVAAAPVERSSDSSRTALLALAGGVVHAAFGGAWAAVGSRRGASRVAEA